MPQGFSVSVYARAGSPFWYARCYLDGGGDKPLRWSTGVRLDSEGGKRGSRRVAQARAEAEARRLADAAAVETTCETGTTINAVAMRMLRQKQADQRRSRAVASLAHNLRKHVEPFFGAGRDIRTIRRPDLEAFKRHLVAAQLAPVTVNNCLTAIRQVLKHAANIEELLEVLPHVPNVKVPKGTRGRALTEEQVGALLDAVQPRELEAQQFLEFVANVGMRKTETLAMRWGWIDWGAAMMRIPAEYRKGGEDRRRVPLNDAALAVLIARRDHGTKYTGRRKEPLPTGPEDRVWIQKKHDVSRNEAAKRAGLGRVRTHDLRHTFGSLAVANGATLTEARDLLGHQTMAMVNHYQHAYEERLKEASQRVQLRSSRSAAAVVSAPVSGEGSKGARNELDRARAKKGARR